MFEPLSEQYAEDLLESILEFRTRGLQYDRPDDVNALLGLFPLVSVRKGFILDYIQSEAKSGMRLPIRPFARPDEDDGWEPIFDPSEVPGHEELVDELWSVRASRHAAEWLESTPIFTRASFDKILDGPGKWRT